MSGTLYIHGLDSYLSDDKKEILSEYTLVVAPVLDFRSGDRIYYDLEKILLEIDIDFIIGSSMGGFMAYHLSLNFNKPALLFNPALPFRSVGQNVPVQNKNRMSYLRVIIGGQDDIVLPELNLDWLFAHESGNFEIRWKNLLGHRIPLNIFKEEISDFFNFQQ